MTTPATDEEIERWRRVLGEATAGSVFHVRAIEAASVIARIDKERRDFIDTVLPIAKAVGLSDPHDLNNPGADWDGPFGALCAARIAALRERAEKAEAEREALLRQRATLQFGQNALTDRMEAAESEAAALRQDVERLAEVVRVAEELVGLPEYSGPSMGRAILKLHVALKDAALTKEPTP